MNEDDTKEGLDKLRDLVVRSLVQAGVHPSTDEVENCITVIFDIVE